MIFLIVIAAFVGLVLMLLIFRNNPAARATGQSTATSGRVRLSRLFIIVATLVPAALGLVGLFFALLPYASPPSQLLAVVFLPIALFVASYLSPIWEIQWDETGLTGPGNYMVPPFGPRRSLMRFDQITFAGSDTLGGFYVEDANGARIRWNGLHTGAPALMDHIMRVRPDLFPKPADPPQD